jgi:hypothetical protein
MSELVLENVDLGNVIKKDGVCYILSGISTADLYPINGTLSGIVSGFADCDACELTVSSSSSSSSQSSQSSSSISSSSVSSSSSSVSSSSSSVSSSSSSSVSSSSSSVSSSVSSSSSSQSSSSQTGFATLQLNGTDEYLNVGNDAELQLTGNFTYSAWINRDVANDRNGIIAKWDFASNQRSLSLEVNDGNQGNGDLLNLSISSNGTAGTITNFTGSTTLSIDTWYHVVATYDGANPQLYS